MKNTCNNVSEIELTYNPTFIPTAVANIRQVEDLYLLLKELFDVKQLTVREEAYVLFLNQCNMVLGYYKLSTGGITQTVVDIRIVLAIALKSLSCSIILAHSHPSGNLTPSRADLGVTKALKEAANIMDIRLLDHFIITKNGYYSFVENGDL